MKCHLQPTEIKPKCACCHLVMVSSVNLVQCMYKNKQTNRKDIIGIKHYPDFPKSWNTVKCSYKQNAEICKCQNPLSGKSGTTCLPWRSRKILVYNCSKMDACLSRLSLCGPLMDWQPVQGVLRLSHNNSWDRLQPWVGVENGWLLDQMFSVGERSGLQVRPSNTKILLLWAMLL